MRLTILWALWLLESATAMRLLPSKNDKTEKVYILQSNDDGWAELGLRLLNDELRAKGHEVFVSAPAENMSGQGKMDKPPTPRTEACHYDSCPAGSNLDHGFNETRPDLAWVNSCALTATRLGLRVYAKQHWKGKWADLVVTGLNVGANLGADVEKSSTCQAAAWIAWRDQTPAIAFSAATRTRLPWNHQPVPDISRVHAELAAMLTQKIIDGGKPYLPKFRYLNVNFPAPHEGCSKVSDFKFVLSRIAEPGPKDKDVEWCGTRKLPLEKDVVQRQGCFASISMGNTDWSSPSTAQSEQKAVLKKLRDVLSCLPEKP
ncbi:hypothetical protein PLIIFM63780_007462 [Purpureocillium lilacinum]|nr:hypothetical protein PLIIFM63780_007462 [Purpureocillium lilacinum]